MNVCGIMKLSGLLLMVNLENGGMVGLFTAWHENGMMKMIFGLKTTHKNGQRR